jgi:hypothetical protein
MDVPAFVVESNSSGYQVLRLIATRGALYVYTAVGAAWETLESAERFADSIAEQEL